MNNPIKEILEWAKRQTHWTEEDSIRSQAKQEVLQILFEYQQDPAWVCLEGMTAGELQAFDYGETLAMAAVKDILDGKDNGQGVCSEPWQTLRQRLVEVVKQANSNNDWECP